MSTIDYLNDNGWREYPNRFKESARCFYKRFDTPTPCHCNDKKGMQVEITVYDRGMEMELAGELQDGTWLRVSQWVLPSDIQQVVSLIPRLLATWEAANKEEV